MIAGRAVVALAALVLLAPPGPAGAGSDELPKRLRRAINHTLDADDVHVDIRETGELAGTEDYLGPRRYSVVGDAGFGPANTIVIGKTLYLTDLDSPDRYVSCAVPSSLIETTPTLAFLHSALEAGTFVEQRARGRATRYVVRLSEAFEEHLAATRIAIWVRRGLVRRVEDLGAGDAKLTYGDAVVEAPDPSLVTPTPDCF